MVEEQLKWFTARFPDTVVPRDLLRSHLTEVINPAMLDEQSSYLGNRLAACTVKQQSLFFSCCGSAGHKLAMTVLGRDTAALQVRKLPGCHPVGVCVYQDQFCEPALPLFDTHIDVSQPEIYNPATMSTLQH